MTVIPLGSTEFEPSRLSPIGCASVGVGIGKTEAVIKSIAELIGKSPDISVVYAVPTHKLGVELVLRFAARDVSSGVWRGRLADNPKDLNTKMCLKPDAIEKIISLGLPIQQSMCRAKFEAHDISCDFFSLCPYQTQAGELCDKQVVIVPHDSLFYEKPNIGPRNMLIIDEAFWPTGLRGL